MSQISVMIIDDEEKMLKILKIVLEEEGYSVITYNNPKAALLEIKNKFYNIIITDLKMPEINGIEVLDFAKKCFSKTEVLIMTAYADSATAVSAIKKGAYDYIVKPFEMDELKIMLSRIIEKVRLQEENLFLHERIETKNIIGSSPAMQEVLRLIEKVAPYDTTVLITGESGTGKELVARALHKLSNNSKKPLIAINCAAIPENLLESELFGYEKGSFTGAVNSKAGLMEIAGTGSILLDEIGELSASIQAKLLRVLQEKEFLRVGGILHIQCQARIITATNRELIKEVKEKRFREDLFYRLNVFPIHIPPLREHREDIPQLIEYFLRKLSKPSDLLTPEAMKLMMTYNWPGNIRELENIIERMVILSCGEKITRDIIPYHIREGLINLYELPTNGISLEEIEKKLIIQALERSKGNKSEAAKLLGITRRKLYSRIGKHKLEV